MRDNEHVFNLATVLADTVKQATSDDDKLHPDDIAKSLLLASHIIVGAETTKYAIYRSFVIVSDK